ncbi:MAG: hypothetical protein VKJ87_01165 [Synechococcus sp.]|nr:hypothetical protein [Synechococcus sp.]
MPVALLLPAVLAVAPLLETASERIVLVDVRPQAEPQQLLVRTERQRLDGSARWQVLYAIDCGGRRLRRMTHPWPSDQQGLAKRAPVSGDDGEWYPERPFTLASRLMQRVCER